MRFKISTSFSRTLQGDEYLYSVNFKGRFIELKSPAPIDKRKVKKIFRKDFNLLGKQEKRFKNSVVLPIIGNKQGFKILEIEL
jgi:hypothetical protein